MFVIKTGIDIFFRTDRCAGITDLCPKRECYPRFAGHYTGRPRIKLRQSTLYKSFLGVSSSFLRRRVAAVEARKCWFWYPAARAIMFINVKCE